MVDAASSKDGKKPRPSLGVKFSCCNVYWRIYLTADQTRFTGHCPKCGYPVTVKVAADGVDSRFFEV
jgi:phage terminase large subunit GpA-like protein